MSMFSFDDIKEPDVRLQSIDGRIVPIHCTAWLQCLKYEYNNVFKMQEDKLKYCLTKSKICLLL